MARRIQWAPKSSRLGPDGLPPGRPHQVRGRPQTAGHTQWPSYLCRLRSDCPSGLGAPRRPWSQAFSIPADAGVGYSTASRGPAHHVPCSLRREPCRIPLFVLPGDVPALPDALLDGPDAIVGGVVVWPGRSWCRYLQVLANPRFSASHGPMLISSVE